MRILVIQTPEGGVVVFTKSGDHQPATRFDSAVEAEAWLIASGYECISDNAREVDPKQRRHRNFKPQLDYISGVYRVGEAEPALVLAEQRR